jgi:hypothetical protein
MTRGAEDEYIYIAFHRMAGESGRTYIIPFHEMEFRTTTLQRRFPQHTWRHTGWPLAE